MIRGDLRAVLAQLPPVDRTDIVAHRRKVAEGILREAASLEPPRDVRIRDLWLPSSARPDSPLRLRVYEPPQPAQGIPATSGLLWIHGGGFSTGLPEAGDRIASNIVETLGITVVSPDYRLAPECPFPAPFEDCLDALEWMGSEQGLALSRIAVGGASAGGTLAAGLALHARDRGLPPLALQLLLYPPLDDREPTDSDELYGDAPVFNSGDARVMWQRYLPADPPVSAYAVPARAEDLNGVAPTFLLLADNDPQRDQGLEYARRLIRAGVPTELHHIPGTFHGFDAIAPDAPTSRQVVESYLRTLRVALMDDELQSTPTG